MGKVCKKCGNAGSFYKDARSKDGLMGSCSICHNFRCREWQKNNAFRVLLNTKIYRDSNKDYYKLLGKEYRNNFPEKGAQREKKRRAAKKQRTPKWLSIDHLNEIKFIESLKAELQWLSEERLEIDHIVPLQGKNVSGLHVPWNLQIIPKSHNLAKGCR